MCWHKAFFSLWPLQSYLSPPPHFLSFGPLQKITTLTVTVIRLCVFYVLCHLHKWFIFVLAWTQPNPSPGLRCPVVFVLLHPATCLLDSEWNSIKCCVYAFLWPFMLPEVLVVSLNYFFCFFSPKLTLSSSDQNHTKYIAVMTTLFWFNLIFVWIIC